MNWNPYYGAYIGQVPPTATTPTRDHRGEDVRGRGTGPTIRDHRGDRPQVPYVPPRPPVPYVPPRPARPVAPVRPVPDPRVTTPPFPQRPDPRVTTYPGDIRPREDWRDRDDRDGRGRDRDRDRDDRRRRYPHPRFRHQDYVYVTNYGWWPRWFPYWEPAWFQYWQALYQYYGGLANPEYAEWARDQVLRAMGRQQGWF